MYIHNNKTRFDLMIVHLYPRKTVYNTMRQITITFVCVFTITFVLTLYSQRKIKLKFVFL